MKYLRLYESIGERSIKDLNISKFLNDKETCLFIHHERLTSLDGIEELINLEYLQCHDNYLTSLKGIEHLTNLKELYCHNNKLESLKGIENLINLTRLDCDNNKLTSIKEIKNLVNMKRLYCQINKIASLEGIENLIEIYDLLCYDNKITNLDEIKNLKKLIRITVHENPLERPGPYQTIEKVKSKFTIWNLYGENDAIKFRSYNFQKEFIEEYPEKVMDLLPLGIHSDIEIEYKELLGFFK